MLYLIYISVSITTTKITQILILIYLSHNFLKHTQKNEENVKKTYVIVFKSTQRIVFSVISKITNRHTYTDSGDRNNSGTRPKDQPL